VSCINDVSSRLVSMIGLEAVPHLCPYTISWVSTTSIKVNVRCLVSIQFTTYKDKIWGGVLTMGTMGHVILGKPWLFDLDVTLRGKSNTCIFNHSGQKIKLILSQPKTGRTEKILSHHKGKRGST